MRVRWTETVGSDYDSEGVPWKRIDTPMAGEVQAYVGVDGEIRVVVLVDVRDGRSCPGYLDSVPLRDVSL